MSHWSSGLTCLLPATRVTGSNPQGGSYVKPGLFLLTLSRHSIKDTDSWTYETNNLRATLVYGTPKYRKVYVYVWDCNNTGNFEPITSKVTPKKLFILLCSRLSIENESLKVLFSKNKRFNLIGCVLMLGCYTVGCVLVLDARQYFLFLKGHHLRFY